MRVALYCTLLAVFLAFAGLELFAQRADRATITGIVNDPTGSPVASATVRIRNDDTGVETAFTTNGAGAYASPLLVLGTYTVNDKFTLFGYETGNLTGTFAGLADGAWFTDAGGLWKINYFDTTAGLNGGTGTSFVTITAIPEPRAALLGGLGLLALLRRRRS